MSGVDAATKRFLSKFDVAESGCWEWNAALRNGYGVFWQGEGHNDTAHRFSYERFVGPLPDGLQIDHLCRNRRCVNPDHLEAVSQRENLVRGVSPSGVNAAKGSCGQGHPFDSVNSYVWIDATGHAHRTCRTCQREHVRRYQRAVKGA